VQKLDFTKGVYIILTIIDSKSTITNLLRTTIIEFHLSTYGWK